MGYKIKWQSKTKEGTTFVPTPKRGWVKSTRTARSWFNKTKGKPSVNNAPKGARVVSATKGHCKDSSRKRKKKRR